MRATCGPNSARKCSSTTRKSSTGTLRPPPLAGYARRAGHAQAPCFRCWWGRCVGLGPAPERVGGGGKRARGALVDREHLHPPPARTRVGTGEAERPGGGEGASGFCAPSYIILSCRAAGRTISWASASSAAWSPTSLSISGSSSFRPRSRSRSHTCAARAVSGACEKRRPARSKAAMWGHVPAVQQHRPTRGGDAAAGGAARRTPGAGGDAPLAACGSTLHLREPRAPRPRRPPRARRPRAPRQPRAAPRRHRSSGRRRVPRRAPRGRRAPSSAARPTMRATQRHSQGPSAASAAARTRCAQSLRRACGRRARASPAAHRAGQAQGRVPGRARAPRRRRCPRARRARASQAAARPPGVLRGPGGAPAAPRLPAPRARVRVSDRPGARARGGGGGGCAPAGVSV